MPYTPTRDDILRQAAEYEREKQATLNATGGINGAAPYTPTPGRIAEHRRELGMDAGAPQEMESEGSDGFFGNRDEIGKKTLAQLTLNTPDIPTSFVRGLANQMSQGLVNIANLPSDLASMAGYDIPRVGDAPEIDVKNRTIAGNIAEGAGGVAGHLMPAGLAYKLASKAIPAGAGLLREGARMGAAGFMAGGPEGGMGERVAPALLGGGFGAISPLAMTRISSAIKNRAREVKDEASTLYNNFFNGLKKEGIEKSRVPLPIEFNLANKKKLDAILTGAGKTISDLKRVYPKLKKKGTFEDVHKFRSDLIKGRSKIDTSTEAGKIKARELDILSKKLSGKMYNFLSKKKRPELIKEYSDATKFYANEVSPFLSKKLTEALKSELKLKPTSKELFLESVGKKGFPIDDIPGMAQRARLAKFSQDHPWQRNLLLAGGAGLGLMGAGAVAPRSLGGMSPAGILERGLSHGR